MGNRSKIAAFIGALLAIAPSGALAGYNLTTLFSFNGINGEDPAGGITADAAGDLFGTTSFSNHNDGSVFELAAGTHAFSTVTTFIGVNGNEPQSPLLIDSTGHLYGTTEGGGPNGGVGTVFELTPASHTLQELAVFNFDNGSDPANLAFDTSGNVYGSTELNGPARGGTVFEYSSANGLTTLASVNPTIQLNPSNFEGVAVDHAGNIYGTYENSGIFKVDAITHALTIFQSFHGAPTDGLTEDSEGNIYGTAGAASPNGNGFIFEIAANGTYKTLAALTGPGATDIATPLTIDSHGNIYGAVGDDFFELPAGSNTVITLATGVNALGAIYMDGSGDFFGTMPSGGTFGDGSVFELSTQAPLPHSLLGGIALFSLLGVATVRKYRKLKCS